MAELALYHTLYDSPVGCLTLVASDTALHAILWEMDSSLRVKLPVTEARELHPILDHVKAQLTDYFAGQRHTFDVPLSMQGTAFQLEVWQALMDIPYGKTISYAELAEAIGRPKAVRAVGAAVGRNPISIVLPCHRVLGKDGKLTGFAGGLAHKATLLTLEQA